MGCVTITRLLTSMLIEVAELQLLRVLFDSATPLFDLAAIADAAQRVNMHRWLQQRLQSAADAQVFHMLAIAS